jgi:hypothetical protein
VRTTDGSCSLELVGDSETTLSITGTPTEPALPPLAAPPTAPVPPPLPPLPAVEPAVPAMPPVEFCGPFEEDPQAETTSNAKKEKRKADIAVPFKPAAAPAPRTTCGC